MKLDKLFSVSRVQHYWRRQDFVKFFFMLVFTVFVYQIVLPSSIEAKKRATNQAQYTETQYARRGDILDRNNKLLASNIPFKKIQLDPMNIPPAFIPLLATALMVDEQTLGKQLAKKRAINSQYWVIKKNIALTHPIISNIKQLKQRKINVCHQQKTLLKLGWFKGILNTLQQQIDPPAFKIVERCKKRKIGYGVVLKDDQRRYYPKSASLAPLLGRVGADNKGASGIEGSFDPVLSGNNGKTLLEQTKEKSYFNPQIINKLQHGESLKLTIDATLQYHAYSAIKESVKHHDADSGSAIILKPNGEVLALVNYPAEDPNDKHTYHAEHYRNRVLSDKVEPGSTMKPFTMLLALDKGKITATDDEIIDVTKRIAHIKADGKYKQLNIKQILQKSHNLGTINVATRLKEEDIYHTWKQLGFGRPLGLIPGIESPGLLKHFSLWRGADKLTISYGYGPMNLNLAQLARAYLVFANEGALPELKLIKNNAGNQEMTQIFSKQSTAKIAHLLDTVVSAKGSGYRAQIKGYPIAGKTGTAEMLVNGSYSKEGAKRTFFVGFTPVKNPAYIMAIRLDHPKKCSAAWDRSIRIKCEGSNSAAIVFKNTMTAILTNNNNMN